VDAATLVVVKLELLRRWWHDFSAVQLALRDAVDFPRMCVLVSLRQTTTESNSNAPLCQQDMGPVAFDGVMPL
jgi:hypothetical protein